MRWGDLIEQIMRENNGLASLTHLYERAPLHREQMPSGDWRKTLRGVLYREAKAGRFVKVGLGVYALPEAQKAEPSSAYQYALDKRSYRDYIGNRPDLHATIEGMLIEIGNYLDYNTYTPDVNRLFDGKRLGDLCVFRQVPDFTYQDVRERIGRCDVIWFSRTAHPFPKYVFEVETTTDFERSMLKMFALKEFETRLVLVAHENRRHLFEQRISHEPFATIASKFHFRPVELVAEFYFNCVEHYELRSRFLV